MASTDALVENNTNEALPWLQHVKTKAQLLCHPIEFVLNSCPDSTHEPINYSRKPLTSSSHLPTLLQIHVNILLSFHLPIFISVWPRRNPPANIQLAEHPVMQHLSDIGIFGSVFG